ncbi:MAG: acetylxylan esterase [Acholeplasmataceae bacterium]|jgi:cephalosporin-C deacetylase|nr:acetylxylan esterase [Acholeplasmataceae bacterium]
MKIKQSFEDFWSEALTEMNHYPLDDHIQNIRQTDTIDEIGDFSYLGAKEERIYGFYLRHKGDPRPTVLMFHGYGWHKGQPEDYLDWYQLGVNVFAIDIRGQRGLTKDQYPYQMGDHRLMTRGLDQPQHYYLKHVYLDGLRLIDFASAQPFVDSSKIILHGGSQGGGIVFALAGLKEVYMTFADVPSYSYFEGRIQTRNGSVSEIADYIDEHHLFLKDILDCLSYFDLINFAPHIKNPLVASVGLADDICPARYFMKAYLKVSVEKELYEYPNAGHEGGGKVHQDIKLNILKKRLSNLQK